MNSLFGLELPAPVNFIVAFVVVLALIGAATWAVKRFGGARMEAASRGRQPRLAVVDSAAVDGRRKLVIVRRDNVEHLLMIGGPSDVVVETSIVRSVAAAAREPAAREPALRATTAEALPRVVPLPDPTPWPLAPEPSIAPAAAAPTPAAPAVRAVDEPQWPVTPVDTADGPEVQPPAYEPEPAAPVSGPGDLSHARPEPSAPRLVPQRPAAAATFTPAEAPAADANLAEMAQRLEAALRRPMATGEAAKPATANVRRIEPRAEAKAATRSPPRTTVAPRAPAVQPATPAAQPREPAAMTAQQAQAKTEFENLEQEMASLLGRPSSGKT